MPTNHVNLMSSWCACTPLQVRYVDGRVRQSVIPPSDLRMSEAMRVHGVGSTVLPPEPRYIIGGWHQAHRMHDSMVHALVTMRRVHAAAVVLISNARQALDLTLGLPALPRTDAGSVPNNPVARWLADNVGYYERDSAEARCVGLSGTVYRSCFAGAVKGYGLSLGSRCTCDAPWGRQVVLATALLRKTPDLLHAPGAEALVLTAPAPHDGRTPPAGAARAWAPRATRSSRRCPSGRGSARG